MNVGRILAVKGSSVVTVTTETPIKDVARILKDRRIGSVVISGDGLRVQGIVSERDIVHRMVEQGAGLLDLPVETIMSRNVVTCTPADTLNDLMSWMTAGRIRHLPVVDSGRLCGMISIGDVVKFRLDEIEHEAAAMCEYIASAG